ncbi:unnamed protein product [Blepharisma stoltei]|uniref:Uncharacterized protein n=1 Tax=Blepharisma stoltei TaxID=1481888 RepID=A0AAU9ITA1_9CILI|nr:unnamed protein product [Blepharisma stoltei]
MHWKNLYPQHMARYQKSGLYNFEQLTILKIDELKSIQSLYMNDIYARNLDTILAIIEKCLTRFIEEKIQRFGW